MRLTSTLTSALGLCCTCVSGCASGTLVPPAELQVVPGSRYGAYAGYAFHAEVQARGDSDGGVPSSLLKARVTLELKGDALEYRMQIRNPGGELVKEAWVSMRGDDSTTSTVVHLFSDAGFRSSTLELRGTGTVRASMRASAVADELQGSPSRFSVVLRGATPREYWTGAVREGR